MNLDAKQEQMLSRATALLPSAQRDDFQRSVRGALATLLHFPPSDAELRDTLRFVLATRGVSVGGTALLPPSQERKFVHDRTSNNFLSWRKPTALRGRGELPVVGKSRRSPQRPLEASE